MMGSRKKVAVFLSNIYTYMVKETLRGLIDAAAEHDVKLVLFTSFEDEYSSGQNVQYQNYDIGDFAVFKMARQEDYDGIISFDTYLPDTYVDKIDELKRKYSIPVVTMGDVKDYSYNIVNDQQTSFRNLIEHLIKVHDCKDLVHVSGHKDVLFVHERAQIFKDTLAGNGLDASEERIYTGNMWYNCGDEVVDKILADYEKCAGRVLPDAIVCVNDYSAIGVVNALKDRGYKVPGDVIVTGYDNVFQAKYRVPSITTSEQPFEKIGRDGIEVLVKLWNNEEVPHTIEEPGVLVLHQSCGCLPENINLQEDISKEYEDTSNKLGDLALSATDIALGMSFAETPDYAVNIIEKNLTGSQTGFRSAALCLLDNWEDQIVLGDNEDPLERDYYVVCGLYNGQPVKREPIPKGQLLPQEMADDPEPYYIISVHHLEYFMGYLVIRPDLEGFNQLNVKTWMVNLYTMLEIWRVKKELKFTVARLDELSNTDMLTSLYNRRGYPMFFKEYYLECMKNRTGLVVFMIDIDRMKYINDHYGHDEGDYALCTVAKAIKGAVVSDEICIRNGGDEFVVLARNYNEEMAEQFIEKVRNSISASIVNDKKDYTFSASFGYYLTVPEEQQDVDELNYTLISEKYIKYADREMYKEKGTKMS